MEHWRGIGKLIEECGEVLQLAGKAIPFPVADHPDNQGPIKPRMEDELADLLAAITYFNLANGLDVSKIDKRCQEKLLKFDKWGLTGIKD